MSKFSRQQARANALGKCQFVVDNRNPSSPQENGAGMKNRDADFQTPPSSMNILPLICLSLRSSLPKTQGHSPSPVCLLSAYLCLNKLSLYFLNLSALSQNSFGANKEPQMRRQHHQPPRILLAGIHLS